MQKSRDLNVIVNLSDCNEMLLALIDFVFTKRLVKERVNRVAESIYLVLDMLPSMEMDGIDSLFHERYSLQECVIVENFLRELRFNRLADLFANAKFVFVGGRLDITQAEYEQIDLAQMQPTQSSELDQIADRILESGSEIYLTGEFLCDYIRSHKEDILTDAKT